MDLGGFDNLAMLTKFFRRRNTSRMCLTGAGSGGRRRRQAAGREFVGGVPKGRGLLRRV
jgi:hypothetical protein